MENVVLHEKPELKSPYLIIAFGGWPDASEAATRGINVLLQQFKARHFAEIDSESFFNYAHSRPIASAEGGSLNQLRLPTVDFYYSTNESDGHDIILARGPEPELCWKTFADTLIKFAHEMGVVRIFSLGALFDNMPHTRAPKVSGLVNTIGLKKLLHVNKVNPVAYRGPSAIQGVLLSACSRARLEMVTLWGHPPYYMGSGANPRVCMSLLETLGRFIGVAVDVEDLRLASVQMDRALDSMVSGDPQLRAQVKEMEEAYDSEMGAEKTSEGTEEVIRDLEDFLRNEGTRGS